MTTRERITLALNNGTPDHSPLTIYDAFVDDINADHWQRLIDQGLGVCAHCPVLKAIEHGVKDTTNVRTEGDHVYRIFRKHADAVGIPKRFSIHSCRHTYASLLYRASDFNLRLVQKQLGHRSIQTTQIYADVLNEDAVIAVERLPQ